MIEAVILAAVSALLYHLGMGFVLFLIPLQVALVRGGRRSFLWTVALALVFITAVKLLIAGRAADPAAGPFLLIELSTVALLTGGLVLIHLPELGFRASAFPASRVMRLLLATAAAGVLSVPVILYLQKSPEFSEGMREIFATLSAAMGRAFSESENYGVLVPGALFDAGTLMQISRTFLLRSYLFDYFLLLTFSWWLGTIIGARSIGRKARITKVVDFKLPEQFVWPLIGSLALVLLNLVVQAEPLEVISWNALLVLMCLYGVAGLGIIRFLSRRLKIPQGLRWLIMFGIVVLALTPRINLVVMILVPGLGVSEIWLKYRTRERREV